MRTLNQLRALQLEEKQKEERKRLSEVAPEMLKMLKFMRRIDIFSLRSGDQKRLLNDIDSVIAKVGGE